MATEERSGTTIEENDPAALRAEIARLRAQVAELTRGGGAAQPAGAAAPGDGAPYRAVFDDLPIPLLICDPEGWAVAVNRINCARFTTTADRVVGKYNILQDPQAVETGFTAAFQQALTGAIARMPPTHYDTVEGLHDQVGRRVWSEATYFPVRDEAGSLFVANVSLDVTAQIEAEAKRRESAALLEAIIDNAPMLIYARDTEGRHTIMNRETVAFFGKPREELLGKTLHELLPAELADGFRSQDLKAMASPTPLVFDERIPLDDGPHDYVTTRFAIRDHEGKVTGVGGISADITERVRAEERSRLLQAEMLRAREELLRSISTPLLPIAPGVLVMPLVGAVTRERAEQVIETLLHGVSGQQARIAILDVTGVPDAGEEVTDALLRAAKCVRMLGAEVVITGIRPSVAQALITLGSDLGGIVTQGTLERGVAYALSRRGAR